MRGTKTVSDFLADLEVESTLLGDSRNGVKVHLGFYRRATDILGAMQSGPELARLRSSPTARLKLTGHSLGGAVAQILGALLVDQNVPAERIGIYTFGAPPFTDETFSRKYGAIATWRVEATGDTIPYVFNGPLAQYRHVGTRVALHENGAFGVGEPGVYPDFDQRVANPSLRILRGLPKHLLKLSYLPRMGFTVTLQL